MMAGTYLSISVTRSGGLAVPRFTVSKVFPAPPAEVFALFTDLDRLPARVKDITKIEWLTDGPVRVGTRYKESRVVFKKEATETFEVTAYEPNCPVRGPGPTSRAAGPSSGSTTGSPPTGPAPGWTWWSLPGPCRGWAG